MRIFNYMQADVHESYEGPALVPSRSAWVGDGPAFHYGADIGDDLAMVRPGQLDRVVCSDTGAAGISRRSEPVVLWGACGARSPSRVCSSIHSLANDFVREDGVIGDDGSCQMMRYTLADVENGL